jgi:hypothetical protein
MSTASARSSASAAPPRRRRRTHSRRPSAPSRGAWSLERRSPVATWSDRLARADVERSLRLELARATWDGAEEESPFILDKEDRAEFASWVRWQKRWRFYRDALVVRGKDGFEAGCIAHDLAGGMRRPSDEGVAPYPGDHA